MKIANNKSILTASCLLVAMVFGAFLSLSVSAQTVTTTPVVCDTANGDIFLDDGTCLRHGSLENTLSRANTGLTVARGLVNTLITIVVALAFFYFFWNLVKYIRDEEDKDAAKTRMGYSLAAIFVIVTLWGLIAFLRGILGVNQGEPTPAVTIPGVGFAKVDSIEQKITIFQDTIAKCKLDTATPSLKPGCYSDAARVLDGTPNDIDAILDPHKRTNTDLDADDPEKIDLKIRAQQAAEARGIGIE